MSLQITPFSWTRFQNDATDVQLSVIEQAIHDTDLLIQNMTLFHLYGQNFKSNTDPHV